MDALFVALGIMVLALLALLLWFVPHLLHQQATTVAGETGQLRSMLLDLLNEQEAVTLRQTQLGSSLSLLRGQLEHMAKTAPAVDQASAANDQALGQLEARMVELQAQIVAWAERRGAATERNVAQDNEAWAYLMSLLAAIQQRVGEISTNRQHMVVGAQAQTLLHELEGEMQHLRAISEDIEKLQWRLRRSLNERETTIAGFRASASENGF